MSVVMIVPQVPTLGNQLFDMFDCWIVVRLCSSQNGVQVRVWQFEERGKCSLTRAIRVSIVMFKKTRHQAVELARAAATSPSQLLGRGSCVHPKLPSVSRGAARCPVPQVFRATSNCFICAIALAGFRFLGQALAQFIIV